MSHTKQPSYSSSRVQRASKINTIETSKLEKQLNYFEQAMIHQCRLTNRAIRLMSISVDHIKSSSGHSSEAWDPDRLTESPSEPCSPETPFFLYGERIWTRKKRKLYKPVSSSSRPWRHWEDDTSSKEAEIFQEDVTNRSLPERITDTEQHAPVSGEPSVGVYPKGGRVIPHQAWEDDTDDVTKKIFKNQARCMEGGQRHTVYQSSGEVMVAEAARNVRGLVRQIKISGRHPVSDLDISLSRSWPSSRRRNRNNDGREDEHKKSYNEELGRGKTETRIRTRNSSAATSRPKSTATC